MVKLNSKIFYHGLYRNTCKLVKFFTHLNKIVKWKSYLTMNEKEKWVMTNTLSPPHDKH